MSSGIKKNFFYQVSYEILGIVLPLLTSPYIARVLGAEQLGIFSYTYSIAYYFQLFGMLGLKFYGNRSIARVRDNSKLLNSTYSELLTVHIVVSSLSTIVYVIYVLTSSTDYQLYSILQGLMVASTIFDISWFFFGIEKFKVIVMRNTVIKLVSVLLVFIFVRSENDLWKYVIIMAGAQLVSQAVMFLIVKKYVKFSFPKIHKLKYHIKPLFVLFIPVVALSLFKYMDKIMLGALGTKIELGYYENSEKILNIPLGIVLAFGSVMLPKMSNLVVNEKQQSLDKYMQISFKYMSALAIAMAFGMAAIAPVFAPIFWGIEFEKCSSLIQFLAISLPFSTIANIVRNQDLIPKGKDKYYSYSIVVGAIANLTINWILIPKYQAYGVVIGTVIAEILVCVVQLCFVWKEYDYYKYIKNILFFLFPGVVMFIIVSIIGNVLGIHIYTLFIQIICGGLVYIIIMFLYLIKTGDEEMLKIIKQFRRYLNTRV